MQGDRGSGPITSWPLVLLIVVLMFIAVAGVNPDVAAILRRVFVD
jgi:hypothetical protein